MCDKDQNLKNLKGGCGKWHYNNITADIWERVKEFVKKTTGKDLPGYEGTVEINKPIYLKVYYKYDPKNLTAEIEIIGKSWYLSCSLIKKKIDEFLSGEIIQITGGCGKWHYDNITSDIWERVKEFVKKTIGIDLPGYEGTVEINKPIYLKVYYKYDPKNLTAEIEIIGKPWYISCSLIKKKIYEFLSGEIIHITGGCGRWHYDNITSDVWERVKAFVKETLGIDLPGYEGTVEINKPVYLKVYYKYDPNNLTAEIEIIDKSWYIPCSLIKKQIDDFLKS